MKRIHALLLIPALLLWGCVPREEPREVTVFAAASLEAALTEIAEKYEAVAPEVKILFSFDSSGTLRTQILEGAQCDLFLSAGQKQLDDLADLISADSRMDILENQVVLAVPEGNPAGITCYGDLTGDRLTLLCIGNSDVPVGSYSLEILKNLNIDITALEAAGKVTYGSNVTEVARQIKEGTVSCGIVYATDAATHGLTLVDRATEALCGRVIYPAAALTENPDARAFFDYLRTSPEARAIWEAVGFAVLP